MIRVENLCYTYGDGSQALKDISVSFPQEHIFAVNGAFRFRENHAFKLYRTLS